MRRSLVSLVACLALGACASMAPTYERPASPLPAQLPASGAAATPATDIPWQAFVLDDRLRQVIALALADS
ncbi:MAG: multidrug transporter, partial [Rhizobacter sp.]